MTHAIKPSPSVKKRENGECKLSLNTGKVAAKPSEGASVSRNEKGFLPNDIEYLPVILERSEKEVENRIMKK